VSGGGHTGVGWHEGKTLGAAVRVGASDLSGAQAGLGVARRQKLTAARSQGIAALLTGQSWG
jgi:hypothetical protein